MSAESLPGVRVLDPRTEVRAVALLLHGGKVDSREPVRRLNTSLLTMAPFARALHVAGAPEGLSVWQLRHRVRGWNGDEASPVGDARWALAEIGRRHPGVPVVLVGHSMGGRTAIRVADDPAVRAVVLLAPWVPQGEPADPLRGRHVAIVHGTADRWTDPGGSRDLARRAAPICASVRHVELRGAGHWMLRRPALWRGLTTWFALTGLAARDDPARTSSPPALLHHPI